MTEKFTLEIIDEDDGAEYVLHEWREYAVNGHSAEAVFYCPKGVGERVFEGRMRAAIDVLNGEDAHDVALLHKIAARDEAAIEDHMQGRVWELVGEESENRHRMTCDLAEALGLVDENGIATTTDWKRMLSMVRARSSVMARRFALVHALLDNAPVNGTTR